MSNETIPHIIQPLRAAVLLSPHDDPTPVQLALVSAAEEMIQVCLLQDSETQLDICASLKTRAKEIWQ